MATSLSKLVDNLTEDIHDDKRVDCKSDLSYMKVIDEALIFRCFNCEKNYEKEINKELIETFIWMVGINLTKHQCPTKNRFTAT